MHSTSTQFTSFTGTKVLALPVQKGNDLGENKGDHCEEDEGESGW